MSINIAWFKCYKCGKVKLKRCYSDVHFRIKWWERIFLMFIKANYSKDDESGAELVTKEMFGKTYIISQSIIPGYRWKD